MYTCKGLGRDNPEKKRGHSAKGLIEVHKELTLQTDRALFEERFSFF